MGYFKRSSRTFSLALVTIIVLSGTPLTQIALTGQAQNVSEPGAIECAEGHPVKVKLPPTFERVPNDNPAVLCVFRSKFTGFPTLNVIAEQRLEGFSPPTLGQYKEGIAKGYQGVGLTDARLIDARVGESYDLPFFTTEVRFTNAGQAMAAEILVVQLHDITYTASAVGMETPQSRELKDLIQALSFDGHSLDLSGSTPSLWRPLGAVVALIATLLLAHVIRNRRRRARRG